MSTVLTGAASSTGPKRAGQNRRLHSVDVHFNETVSCRRERSRTPEGLADGDETLLLVEGRLQGTARRARSAVGGAAGSDVCRQSLRAAPGVPGDGRRRQ